MAVLLALVLALSFAACGQKSGEEEYIHPIPNPMTEYESLEALNEAGVCNFVHPGVMGVTDESYASIDCGDYIIYQYKFDINGDHWCVRCAGITDDISGIYDGDSTFFAGKDLSYDYAENETTKAFRWFHVDGQYCISVTSPDYTSALEMDKETFMNICEELKSQMFVDYSADGDDIIEPIPNPVTEYDSLQDLNEAGGCNFVHPAVMGVTEESFSSVNCGDYEIYQYKFELNGNNWCVRCAGITDDISGIYSGDKTLFEGQDLSYDYAETETTKAYRWFHVDGQYCISVTSGDFVSPLEMDKETFMGICDELHAAMFVDYSA